MVGKCIQSIVNIIDKSNEYVFTSSKECDLTKEKEVDLFFENNKFTNVIHLAACVGGLYKNMKDNHNMFQKNIKMIY